MLGKLLKKRYRIIQSLNSGGFCQTYLAQDISLFNHPNCIVKHLLPVKSKNFNSLLSIKHLFTREVEALGKLSKYSQFPHLLAYFEEDQEFYLVQELIEGHSLTTEIYSGCCWSEVQVIEFLQEVLGILEVVHSHGLIHRDLKPSNLIRRKHDGQLVLIDFGSVKQVWTQVITDKETTITTFATGIAATIAIGTPGYMPAEQERGIPRPSSDLYALGMIAIQGLTGLSPTQLLEDSQTGEILWQQHAQLSSHVASVVSKMVCYHFKDRYQSATEALKALSPLNEFHHRPLAKQRDCPQPVIAAKQLATITLFEQDNKLPRRNSKSQLQATHNKSAFTVRSAYQCSLFVGLVIGVISSLTVMAMSYYFSHILTPTPTSEGKKLLR